MEITPDDKQIMISTLQTLHRNSVNDLLQNIETAKNLLSSDIYQLMLNGDEFIYDESKKIHYKEQYRKITSLEGRWCLKTIIFYHYSKTEKISLTEYRNIIKIL